MLNLSQQEYVKKIDDMNRTLCQAWDRDHKVKALKIAIQVYNQYNDMPFNKKFDSGKN